MRILLFILLATLLPGAADLTGNIVVYSPALDYNLQYRVYTPPGMQPDDALPVLFVADGQWYIDEGDLPALMDSMIAAGAIEPVMAVFIDNRNPDFLRENRRARQFFCNEKYIRFVTDELVPIIDRDYPTAATAASRTMLGLSFGGLNAACFGLYAHTSFGGIAMQSPAMHPVPTIWQAYEDSTRLPLNVFLSSGDRQDNEARTRRLRDILQAKGYPMRYLEVPYGHNWQNWGPLLDDVLTWFYSQD